MAVKTILMIENSPHKKGFESLRIYKITLGTGQVSYRIRMSNDDIETAINYTKEQFQGIVKDLVSALL